MHDILSHQDLDAPKHGVYTWLGSVLRLEHPANLFPLAHVVGYYATFITLLLPGMAESAWARCVLWSILVTANYSLSIGVIHIHSHRKIFTRQLPNRVLEFLLTFPSLNSYPMMRFVHVYLHHKHEDGPDDPTSTIPYRNGARIFLYWLIYSCHCMWITRGALFSRDAKPIWRKMRLQFCVDTVLPVMIATAWAYFRPLQVLYLWLCPLVVVWVNIGFFAWLTHAPAYSGPINGSLNTVNRWMNIFIHNQGFHTIHHRYPAIHWTEIPEHLDMMLDVDDRLIVSYWVLLPSAWHVATSRTLRNESFARAWKQRFLKCRENRTIRNSFIRYFSWI